MKIFVFCQSTSHTHIVKKGHVKGKRYSVKEITHMLEEEGRCCVFVEERKCL